MQMFRIMTVLFRRKYFFQHLSLDDVSHTQYRGRYSKLGSRKGKQIPN